MSGPQFHRISFGSRKEAGAFVAALSRLLDSPRTAPREREAAEVWSSVSAGSERIDLYLNDSAKAAAACAFAPLPAMPVCPEDEVSSTSRLILKGRHLQPRDSAEAERALCGQ